MRPTLVIPLLLGVVFLAGRGGAQVGQPIERSDPARVHGRLVDEAGLPIAEARLLVRGNPRPRAQGVTTAPPPRQPWQPPAPTVTGSDGRFEVSFEAPEGHEFGLALERAGFERRGWRWRSLAPGADVGLGDVVLRPAATLVVLVVDQEGNLLVDGWIVRARPVQVSSDTDPAIWPVASKIDPETGACRIEGLPAGWVSVGATTRGGLESIPERRVSLLSATENTVELVHVGPLERDMLRVELNAPLGCPFEPAPGAVRAIGRDGIAIVMQRHRGQTNIWFAEPSVEGAHTIVVSDTRFVPVALEHARVGQLATSALIGSASLVLEVVAEHEGGPVLDHGLALQYHSVAQPRGPQILYEPGQRGAADGQAISVVPGELSLHVSSPRHPSSQVRLAPLAAGETRTVRISLSEPVTLRGLVVEAGGAPVAGAVVLLTQGTVHGHDLAQSTIVSTSDGVGGARGHFLIPYRDQRVVSDAAGRFVVAGLARGSWAVHVAHGPFVHLAEVRELAGVDTEWHLALPLCTEVSFQLTGLDDRGPGRFSLTVHPLESTPTTLRAPGHVQAGLSLPADASGRFGPVRLPVGPQMVSVIEERRVGTTTKRLSPWQGKVEVTPGLSMDLDVGRR